MHQGVDALGGCFVGKGTRREFLALQHAFKVDSRAEFGLDGFAQGCGLRHEPLGRVVGVVHGDSEFFKGFGGGGFSAADGSGKADVEHGWWGLGCEGRDCLRRSRGAGAGLPAALPWGANLLPLLALSLKTHRLSPVPFFYALSLLKYISMRPGHKKTRPFGAGFQAQSLIFSGEGGIRTRGTVTRTAV